MILLNCVIDSIKNIKYKNIAKKVDNAFIKNKYTWDWW